MNDGVIRLTVFLNQIANSIGRVLLSPIGILPDFLAAALVATFTGILTLVVFKRSSNQPEIQQVRNRIRSELLALSLFQDSLAVNFRSQQRIAIGGLKLAILSLKPMAVMIVPISLLLGQLSLWWQFRPLRVGEDAVVTLNLGGTSQSPWPHVMLRPSNSIESITGPVRVLSKRAVCWNVRAKEAGYLKIVFDIDGQQIDKEFAVGQSRMRVSPLRPEWKWSEVLFNPAEIPVQRQSAARSIEIQFPPNISWPIGRNSWLIVWFSGSAIAAFCFRRVLNVEI